MESDSELSQELKNKRICRFCMTIEEPLSNIYSNENRINCRAPLPLQIMACVSIEVFTNDGMPGTICNPCRLLMDHCYRFKQMCKRADTVLKQFPLTGTWPQKLEHPIYPAELLKLQHQKPSPQIPRLPSSVTVKRGNPPAECKTAPKRSKLNSTPQSSPILKDPIDIKSEEPQNVFYEIEELEPEKPITPPKSIKAKPADSSPKTPKASPRILNKNTVKILNINAPKKNFEPVISKPILQKDERGNVEVVSCEILENIELEHFDPIKNAPPVETNVFPCTKCERSFPLRQLLDIHMNNHGRERNFICDICNKAFFSKYDLAKHNLVHTGERPYVCVVCNKAFSRSTLLARHEKVHTDQPKFLCVYCERPFLSTNELEKHTERHNKRRPYQCNVCDKSFAFKQGLERHEVIHSNKQPHQCEHCDKSFSTPSKLARHLTAHAGQRPYPCRLCPKSYLLSHHLTRHIRSHKDGVSSYKCFDCELIFNTRDELIYHSAVHATQNLTCPLCKEKFSDLDGVTTHIKSHTEGEQYACVFCDLIFTTEDKLKMHCDANHAEEQDAYIQDSKTRIVKNEVDTGDEMSAVAEPSKRNTRTTKKATVSKEEIDCETVETATEHEEHLENYETFETQEYDDTVEDEMLGETYEITDESNDATPATNSPVKEQNISSVHFFPAKQVTAAKNPHPVRITRVVNCNNQSNIPTDIQKIPASISVADTKQPENTKFIPVKSVKNNSPSSQQETPKILNKYEHLKIQPTMKVTSKVVTAKHSPPTPLPAKKSPPPPAPARYIKPSPESKKPTEKKEKIEMQIDNKSVRVQRVKMTKSQVAAMARQGKIEVKDGQVFLKQRSNAKKNSN